jgi:hypothetical protein
MTPFNSTLTAIAFVAGTLMIPPAQSMVLTPIGTSGEMIELKGEIQIGDSNTLDRYLKTRPGKIYISLNSPGGNVGEMLRMASLISTYNATTSLDNATICASSCFWLFAAGHHRSIPSTARLGVHSVSDMFGHEVPDATVMLARLSHSMHIPNQIIGKMVTTPPNQIAWLDCDDLVAMNVEILHVNVRGTDLKQQIFCKDPPVMRCWRTGKLEQC